MSKPKVPVPESSAGPDLGAEAAGQSPELLIGLLRDANEKLVLSALQAQHHASEANDARERLEASERAALEANRRKDLFLAMLGHELRNPLAPIVTALEMMKLRGDQSSLREREVIERQVRHMVRLIDDLLDVSRIASGKFVVHLAPTAMSDVVEKAIEMAAPLIENRRHTLRVVVPAPGPLVSADPSRLAQVIANLLTNAAKYTEPGGHISITVSEADGWVDVRVQDDGTGIEPDLQATIFDQFVQAEQSIDRKGGGLGLGLAIARSLVGLHGGTISAHSDGPGRGSTFVVRLPALHRTSAGEHMAQPSPSIPRASAPSASLHRVLVVDDNVDAAEMLAEHLTTYQYTVALAHDGPEALREAARFDPHTVVLDIGLPIMDGYEVARALRTRERSQPDHAPARLIALTGYGQDSDRERSASAGFDVHLVKPVDVQALQDAITARVPGAASGRA